MSRPWRIRVRRLNGPDCDHLSTTPCTQCAADLAKPIALPAYHAFPETIYEHLFAPGEVMYPISSREQLRQECDRRGVYSKALRDSMHFQHGPTKWF